MQLPIVNIKIDEDCLILNDLFVITYESRRIKVKTILKPEGFEYTERMFYILSAIKYIPSTREDPPDMEIYEIDSFYCFEHAVVNTITEITKTNIKHTVKMMEFEGD